jgi:glycosyltransferase involved in cell wall biosynthesis
MKIVVYSHRKYGCGASVAAARLACALKAAGHQVVYIHNLSGRTNTPLERAKVRVLPLGSYSGWRYVVKRGLDKASSLLRRPISDAVLERRLRVQLAEIKPDVISLHNNFFSADFLKELSKSAPIVWTMHDCFAVDQYHYKVRAFEGEEITYREPAEWTVDPRGPGRLLGFPGKFSLLSPSKWLADRAIAAYKGKIPVKVLPNVVPENVYTPRDKAACRESIGIDKDGFYVLFLAGTGAWRRKNFAAFIKALELCADLDLKVLLCGGLPKDYPLADPRILRVKENWDENVVASLYNAADVFCISSVLDNMPNTIVEAMACGVPIIASRAGGIPEAVQEDSTGWLFDPYDPATLAQALRKAYERRAELPAMGQRARDVIVSQQSTKAAAAKHVELFEGLVAEHKKSKVAVPFKMPARFALPFASMNVAFDGTYKTYRKVLSKLRDSHIYPYKTYQPSLPLRIARTQFYRAASYGVPLRRNERRITAYKNCYAGRRAFLIGNGPSLNKLDLTLLKDEITIGVNSIFLARERMGFLPTHYVVEDVFVAEDRADQINALRGTQKWFGNYLRYCLKPDPDTLWLNVRMRYDNYKNFPYFSGDAGRQVWTGGSVTYICMQLAYYFGIKDLYLIGFDHHYDIPKTALIEGNAITSTTDDPNHFDPTYFGKGYRWHDPMVERMELGYKKAAKEFVRRGGAMYNATAGGKLECLPRVDYHTLFEDKTEPA